MKEKKAGIQIKYQDGYKPDQNASRVNEIEQFIELYERTASMFHYFLMETEQGKKALEYITKRGLTKETIEKFKLALICTMKKRAKMSEKAYVCLKIAWLRRAQLKELEGNKDADPKIVDMIQKEYEGFYSQAYEGFMKAVSSETPPYCGMASEAVEYMLANMSVHYKKYDAAMKLIARLIQSPSTSRKLKDKCLELKEDIVAKQGAK